MCNLAQAVVQHVFLFTLSKKESHQGSGDRNAEVRGFCAALLLVHRLHGYSEAKTSKPSAGQERSNCGTESMGNESTKLVVLAKKPK